MDFLNDFGVKPIFLLAQIVNFLLLLFILKRFLYKPILKVLEERKQKIASGLKNAEEIEKRLTAITLEREEKIREAAKESEKIIKEATVAASKIVEEAHHKAASDIERMVAKAEESNAQEREKLRSEIRGELANLVSAGLKVITGKVLSSKDQKDILEKSLKGLS